MSARSILKKLKQDKKRITFKEKVEKMTITLTPSQADWVKRNLEFDPYEEEYYIVEGA